MKLLFVFLLILSIKLDAMAQATLKITAPAAEAGPQFPGGDDSLAAFLHRNIKYPPETKGKKINDTVFVGFTVDREGNISNLTAKLKGNYPDEAIRKEVLRVVKLMPKWKPAASATPEADGERDCSSRNGVFFADQAKSLALASGAGDCRPVA